jgi:hypothetical protein
MSFWERHKNALLFAACSVGLYALIWAFFLIGLDSSAQGYQNKNFALEKEMVPYFPEIKNPERGRSADTLKWIEGGFKKRGREYQSKLNGLMNRLKYPFKEDKIPEFERPGLWVIRRADIVEENVDKYRAQKGAKTKLAVEWLAFDPDKLSSLVTRKEAHQSLRRLELAQRITKLAIDSGMSWVIKVKPLPVIRDGAWYSRSKVVSGKRKLVREAYQNRFIVNYPVGIEVIGSVKAVMKFVHGARDGDQFLVVRSFNVLNPQSSSSQTKGLIGRDEVMLTMSAACMDFIIDKPGKNSSGKTVPIVSEPGDPSNYKPPTGPLGF